jgi:hypothetical protein
MESAPPRREPGSEGRRFRKFLHQPSAAARSSARFIAVSLAVVIIHVAILRYVFLPIGAA